MWLIVIAMVAVWILYAVWYWMKTDAAPPRLVGDGCYAVEVAGGTNYLASFEKICGNRTADCINRKTEAFLILEDDNRLDKQAVRVSIEGYTVGYLPRAAARSFRHAVVGVGLGQVVVFECAAYIRGGWDYGNGRQGNYGVWLDLPTDGVTQLPSAH